MRLKMRPRTNFTEIILNYWQFFSLASLAIKLFGSFFEMKNFVHDLLGNFDFSAPGQVFYPWTNIKLIPIGHKNLPLHIANSPHGHSSFSEFCRYLWKMYLSPPMNGFFLEEPNLANLQVFW